MFLQCSRSGCLHHLDCLAAPAEMVLLTLVNVLKVYVDKKPIKPPWPERFTYALAQSHTYTHLHCCNSVTLSCTKLVQIHACSYPLAALLETCCSSTPLCVCVHLRSCPSYPTLSPLLPLSTPAPSAHQMACIIAALQHTPATAAATRPLMDLHQVGHTAGARTCSAVAVSSFGSRRLSALFPTLAGIARMVLGDTCHDVKQWSLCCVIKQ